MEFTRSQIHALGKRIRLAYSDESNNVTEEDLLLLQDYRTSYREIIADVFKILHDCGIRVDRSSIVTYRLKRLNSIMRKLSRYPDLPLDRLIDIAGCRCIVQNTEQVYEVLELLKLSDKLVFDTDKDVKDYIKNPQDEGYKSLHVYVSLKEHPNKKVEIQIRDITQHNWATLIEIFDVILGTKLKEYSEPKDLLEFHRILSVPDTNWTMAEKEHYFAMLDKYQIMDRLHRVFAQNILVRYDWMCSQGSSMRDFYLITVQPNYRTSIQSFRTFKEAEDAYFDVFAKEGNSNVVLTQIQNAAYEQISTAYSNYVLSSHKFTDDCLNRYLELIKQALDREDFTDYKTALNSYYNALANQIVYFNQEQQFINSNKYPQKVQKQKIREWKRDTQAKINVLMERKKLLLSYYRNIPTHFSWFYFRVKSYTSSLGQKYDAKVQSLSQNMVKELM